MTARKIAFALMFVAVPGMLQAQRSRRGGSSTGSGATGGDVSTGTSVRTKIDNGPIRKDNNHGIPTSKQLQKENMVALILDKKKDLKLSDDEVKALKEINDHLKDTVSHPLHSLDSIQSELKAGGDFRAAQIFAPNYAAEVRAQYDEHLKAAMSKLTEEHQKSASELVEAKKAEMAKDKG